MNLYTLVLFVLAAAFALGVVGGVALYAFGAPL